MRVSRCVNATMRLCSSALLVWSQSLSIILFFNHTPTTEIYTLSLHDALPISLQRQGKLAEAETHWREALRLRPELPEPHADRKSTRLNSSHRCTSYGVFCLKKKNMSDILPEIISPNARLPKRNAFCLEAQAIA